MKLWTEVLTRAKTNSSNEKYRERDLRCLKRQLQQLADMENFAKSNECRRKVMLNYLGEDYDIKNCLKNIATACDNCIRNIDDEDNLENN